MVDVLDFLRRYSDEYNMKTYYCILNIQFACSPLSPYFNKLDYLLIELVFFYTSSYYKSYPIAK